jgi:GntR family histidine utilization transcriptional repressor
MPATYKSVKSAMLARLVAGEWAPGELIPNEEDLARDYGCSRATVNRALRELAEAGLVDRRRRAGTRVARRDSRGAAFTIPIVRNEIESSGRRYGYALLERKEVAADGSLAGRLDVPAGTRVLLVRCLHLADGEPFQLETRWINLDAVPGAADVGFEDVSPNEWLVAEVPYSRSEHMFSAAAADAEELKRLRLRAGEPVFVIERRTWLGEQPVTYVRLSHLGSSFRMVSRDDRLA